MVIPLRTPNTVQPVPSLIPCPSLPHSFIHHYFFSLFLCPSSPTAAPLQNPNPEFTPLMEELSLSKKNHVLWGHYGFMRPL